MPVKLPHFSAPFQLGGDGKPVAVEQDSPDDVAACVYNIVVCPKGAKLNDPDFGVVAPLFGTFPPNWRPVLRSIEIHEPRADIDSIENVLSGSSSGEIDAKLLVRSLTQVAGGQGVNPVSRPLTTVTTDGGTPSSVSAGSIDGGTP